MRFSLRPAAIAACVGFLTAAAPSSGLCEEPLKSTPSERKSVHITIYNGNFGLVKEVRDLSMPKGVHDLYFEGVAALIDPTSVHIRSLDAPGDLAVLEQNFEYDLVSPAKLMEKYLGMLVELVQEEEGNRKVVEAKLIGTEGGYVYEIDGKVAINPPGRVVLPSLPKGLISKPSLVWKLENGRERHTVEATYLTNGINWKADYVAVLSGDDRNMDLSGWVTIDNQSGAIYEDAALKLVAGDVNRVQPERVARVMEMSDALGAGKQAFEEEAFFEYHLYTLGRKTTIKNNQTKQIALLDAGGVAVEKSYVYTSYGRYYVARMGGPDKETKVGVYLKLDNSKRNNLGMPLPRGLVRVYKRDADGSLQFVGEDQIDHTPEDETIRVKMGDAFDIVGERVQTDYKVLGTNTYETSFKTTLRNHKDENVVVSVIEQLTGDWEIVAKSHSYVKESSHRVRFDVPVERKSSADLTFTVRVRY